MKAEEKAKELVERFRMYDVEVCDLMGSPLDGYEERHYKKCALICVDEMCRYLPTLDMNAPYSQTVNEYCREYWKQVRKEIEKL